MIRPTSQCEERVLFLHCGRCKLRQFWWGASTERGRRAVRSLSLVACCAARKVIPDTRYAVLLRTVPGMYEYMHIHDTILDRNVDTVGSSY